MFDFGTLTSKLTNDIDVVAHAQNWCLLNINRVACAKCPLAERAFFVHQTILVQELNTVDRILTENASVIY